MKKAVLILAATVLLIAANVFAAGDLYVTGKLGVGTTTPGATLDVIGYTKIDGTLSLTKNWTNPVTGGVAGRYQVFIKGSDMQGDVSGAGGDNDISSQENILYYGSDKNDTYNFTNVDMTAFSVLHQRIQNNNRNMNFDNIYGLKSAAIGEPATGSGKIFMKNFYHAFFSAFNYSSMWQADNVYGLFIQGDYGYGGSGIGKTNTAIWINKTTKAAKNYGIVLNGDGDGSDIAFGEKTGVRPRLYSENGVIYADDVERNHTRVSPHDPETGEWIYYSKNLRTGKVKQVNMEKLVKAVEKITGEKFMFETIEEVK